MATKNVSGGKTAANMGVAGALAFIFAAWLLPEFGMETPAGLEAAFTALFGGLIQYLRD